MSLYINKYFQMIIVLVILFLPEQNLLSQMDNVADTTNPLRSMDTLCYRYKFIPNDTLIYSVNSFDSITINFSKPLLKNRIEKWQIVCKSIDEQNRYVLGIKMIDFKSKEKEINSKPQDVYDSPWLDHEILVTVDSLGDRYYNHKLDTSVTGVGPGGVFQPLLIFPFLRGCKPINQTWIVNSTDTLVENAYPVPLMKQVSLFRLNPVQIIDSDSCAALEYVKSGQGVFLSAETGLSMNVTTVINSFGELLISLGKNLPIRLNTTIEQKLTIHLPNEQIQSGFHFISSSYNLIAYKKYVAPMKTTSGRNKKSTSRQR